MVGKWEPYLTTFFQCIVVSGKLSLWFFLQMWSVLASVEAMFSVLLQQNPGSGTFLSLNLSKRQLQHLCITKAVTEKRSG